MSENEKTGTALETIRTAMICAKKTPDCGSACINCPYYIPKKNLVLAYELAEKALERENEKEWEKKCYGHTEDTAVCPICGEYVSWEAAEYIYYCPNCGQKLRREKSPWR